MELDRETQAQLRQGQLVEDGVKSEFWQFAKAALTSKVDLLDSLTATVFEGKSDEEIARETKARASAVQIIREWITQVEATAEQHKANKLTLDKPDEEIIQRF